MGMVDRGIRLALCGAVLALAGCSDCSLSVETNLLPTGTVASPYFAELESDCGGDFWFIQDGQLPPGIGLQDNGDVEGTPIVAGTFTFVVGVFDFGSDDTAFKGLQITVEDPA
jgi:hypothetical protein